MNTEPDPTSSLAKLRSGKFVTPYELTQGKTQLNKTNIAAKSVKPTNDPLQPRVNLFASKDVDKVLLTASPVVSPPQSTVSAPSTPRQGTPNDELTSGNPRSLTPLITLPLAATSLTSPVTPASNRATFATLSADILARSAETIVRARQLTNRTSVSPLSTSPLTTQSVHNPNLKTTTPTTTITTTVASLSVYPQLGAFYATTALVVGSNLLSSGTFTTPSLTSLRTSTISTSGPSQLITTTNHSATVAFALPPTNANSASAEPTQTDSLSKQLFTTSEQTVTRQYDLPIQPLTDDPISQIAIQPSTVTNQYVTVTDCQLSFAPDTAANLPIGPLLDQPSRANTPAQLDIPSTLTATRTSSPSQTYQPNSTLEIALHEHRHILLASPTLPATSNQTNTKTIFSTSNTGRTILTATKPLTTHANPRTISTPTASIVLTANKPLVTTSADSPHTALTTTSRGGYTYSAGLFYPSSSSAVVDRSDFYHSNDSPPITYRGSRVHHSGLTSSYHNYEEDFYSDLDLTPNVDQDNMSEARAIENFKGLPTEDAEEWLRNFRGWIIVRKYEPHQAAAAAGLFLRDGAKHWYNSLPESTRMDSIGEFLTAFEKRYVKVAHNEWKANTEFYDVTQKSTQTVHDYFTELEFKAQKTKIDQSVFLQLALKGLHPSIRQQVLQHEPTDWEALKKWAIIAENAAPTTSVDSPEIAKLLLAVHQMQGSIQKLEKVNPPVDVRAIMPAQSYAEPSAAFQAPYYEPTVEAFSATAQQPAFEQTPNWHQQQMRWPTQSWTTPQQNNGWTQTSWRQPNNNNNNYNNTGYNNRGGYNNNTNSYSQRQGYTSSPYNNNRGRGTYNNNNSNGSRFGNLPLQRFNNYDNRQQPQPNYTPRNSFNSNNRGNNGGFNNRPNFTSNQGNNRQTAPQPAGRQVCTGCGNDWHADRNTCPAKDVICHFCSKQGHYKRVCRQAQRAAAQPTSA